MKQEEIIAITENILLNHWFPLSSKEECSPSTQLMTILLFKRQDMLGEGMIPPQYLEKIIVLLNGNQEEDYTLSLKLLKGFGVEESALQALFPDYFEEEINRCFSEFQEAKRSVEITLIIYDRLDHIEIQIRALAIQMENASKEEWDSMKILLGQLKGEEMQLQEEIFSPSIPKEYRCLQTIILFFFKLSNQEISETVLDNAIDSLIRKLAHKISLQ